MYAKLGGKEAIEGVVDEFYARVFADDEVKGFFEGINKQRLKAHQVKTHSALTFHNTWQDGFRTKRNTKHAACWEVSSRLCHSVRVLCNMPHLCISVHA